MTKQHTNPRVGESVPAAFVLQWKLDRLAAQWDARKIRRGK